MRQEQAKREACRQQSPIRSHTPHAPMLLLLTLVRSGACSAACVREAAAAAGVRLSSGSLTGAIVIASALGIILGSQRCAILRKWAR